MKEYSLLRAAQADMDEQWIYLAERSEQAAARMKLSLTLAFERLVDFPNLGRARPEFTGGLRSFPVDNFVIYYRVLENKIEIVRVLHGAADPTDLFAPAPDETP